MSKGTMMFVMVLFMLSGQHVSAQDPEKVVVPRSLLTREQLSQVSGSDLRTNVHEWAGVGKEVGEAVNASLSAVTTQTNNFAQTPVGKLTVMLVVWRVIGDQIVHLAFGFIEIAVFLPIWIWSYRRMCLTRRIKIDKDKYQVIEYKRDNYGDCPPRPVHAGLLVLLVAVVLFTVFSY